MDPKRVARKKVAARLKRFFEHLTSRDRNRGPVAKGRASTFAETTASETGTPRALRTPMQQQPVQQQQAQTKAEDK